MNDTASVDPRQAQPTGALTTPILPIAERLACFAHDLDPGRLPSDLIERAKLHLLDSIGIGLASTGFEFA